MPHDVSLSQASYRGAFFFVNRTNTSGGRKDAKTEQVGNDRQTIDDLGLRQRVFTLTGTIAARRDNEGGVISTYEEVRDGLLDALELGGTGVLIHPFYGPLYNIAARTWSLEESMQSLGDSRITMTFEVSNTGEDGTPVEEPTTQAGVNRDNEILGTAVNDGLVQRFKLGFVKTFLQAVAKVTAAIDKIKVVTDKLEQIAEQVDEFAAEIDDIAKNIIELVQFPQRLADSFQNIMSSMRNLFAAPETAFNAFVDIFDFGDNDPIIVVNTAARIEEQRNNDVLNVMMQGAALGWAYQTAAESSFNTVDQLDAASQVLEAQFQKMLAADQMDADQLEALQVLRITTRDFFAAQRLTQPKVITVRTARTSAALLAFQYYGSTELASAIAKLNDLRDPSFIPAGDVKILELPQLSEAAAA